jgi:hypothetical protein
MFLETGTTGKVGGATARHLLAQGRTVRALVRDRAISGTPSSDKVGHLSEIPWRHVLALALAAFFVVGSISNILAPGSIYEEYLKWGYPRWFHFVTGSLELTTAVLLLRERTRLLGAALGCAVMLAALATVTLHGEYGHGAAPIVAAALTLVVGWITWRARFSGAT